MTPLNAHKAWKPTLGLFATAGFALAAINGPAAAQSFSVTSLVTDNQAYLTSQGYSAAVTVDPNLINPWGMDHAPGGPWFIGNTGTEATMSGSSNGAFYTGAGVKVGSNVSIPEGAVPPNGPTGVVYNSSASGFSLPGGGHSQFFVASLDGTISGVGSGSSAATQVAAGQTPPVGPPHSIYTGLTMGNDGGASYLYAANNATGQVDVYNSSFQQVTLAGDFTDPTAAADGLAAYNVQNLDGKIWVTYAIPGPASAEAGLGSGAVAEFNADGTLVKDFASGGELSSPWALALAPTSFGTYGGDLLVGNFSHDDGGQTDAFINIFNPTSGAYLGTLNGADGKPILLPGLWDIEAGDGGLAGSSSNLYFTAGIGDEQHGLFGSISAAPEPGTWVLMFGGIAMMGGMLRLTKARRRGPEVAPVAAA